MKYALGLVLLAALAFAPRAHAQTCTMSAGTGTLVDFSAYTAVSGTSDAQGSLSINCTTVSPLNLPITYSISIGAGTSSTFTPRTMTYGGNSLQYNLYRDATRLLVWGDGTAPATTSRQSGSCSGGCTIFVYGRIPGGQHVVAGPYSDQVQVTLDF